MENRKVTREAEEKTIIKPTVNTDPEIIELKDLEDRLQDYWIDVAPKLFPTDYVYIRMKNNHLEVGPAKVEMIE